MPLVPLQADILGPDFRVETISLPPDPEGPVVATLVTLAPEHPNGRAVLHVHGFADYFFQTAAADFWVDRGYDFYALDLRKYGRSLRDHQTPQLRHRPAASTTRSSTWRCGGSPSATGTTTSSLSAHSTGGLTAPLWVHDRRPAGWRRWC